MKILNFGSLNIDHVYQLDHFVRPGETIACRSYERFAGGKGLNQSVALARAGADVYHGGRIGQDGKFLMEILEESGADTRFVFTGNEPTGHALIQVDKSGENAIIISGGANRRIGLEDIEMTMASFGPDDYLLVQNEISSTSDILKKASERGMTIAFNPAPFTPEVLAYPLDLVDLFIVNETEAAGLTDQSERDRIQQTMRERFGRASTIFTLGSQGALFIDREQAQTCTAHKVDAIDTTGAGDTFIGFFLASYTRTRDVNEALATASAAAAISVTRPGAASSIPTLDEVEHFMKTNK